MRIKTVLILHLFIQLSWVNYAWANYEIPLDANVLIAQERESFEEVPQQNLKLLLWNFYKQKNKDFYQNFKNDLETYDFILAQEVNYNKVFQTILSDREVNSYFSISFIHKDIPTGVAVFSRYQSKKIKWLRTIGREPFIKTPKMSILTYFKVEGFREKLLLISTHGINFVRFKKFKMQINRIKKELVSHKGPIVFAGDFNTWSKDRLKYLLDQIRAIKLKKITPEHPHLLKSFLGHKLDHIFIRGLKILSSSVLDRPLASDHNPIELVFDIID